MFTYDWSQIAVGKLRPAFTLVELIVTIVIISILASLSLAGLNATRGRAKAESTRSTIRKLNEIIVPRYDQYMRRRVPALAGTPTNRARAADRVLKIRTIQMREMPDTWADVYADLNTVNSLGGTNAYLKTAPVRAFAQLKNPGVQNFYNSEECLYMIIARGGFEPDILEGFRSDEIGDTDGDGAPEFVDAWGTPIAFIRWAPGHSGVPLSYVQNASATNFHDPFDPHRIDPAGYGLVPLIVSAGADASFGLIVASRQSSGWNGLNLASIITADPTTGAADSTSDSADNISNHNFVAK